MLEFSVPFELRFVIALGLAFLMGLERESSGARTKGRVFAGVRTYSLIGIFGFGCAWLFQVGIQWAMPMGLLSVSALALVGYLAKLKEGHVGWTSEVAALVTFVTGALSLLASIWVPLSIGIISTFLLSEKTKMEQYVKRLDENEFLAVLKFLIVTLIILPVLPDKPYTEFNLNPRHIWQIVVLVSAIGFVGYFLTKKFGGKVGLWLSGILGGIVSSTAVSISAGRTAQRNPNRSVCALQASILASSVMYLRILVLIWLIRPEFAHFFWWKLVMMALIGVLLSIGIRSSVPGSEKAQLEPLRNPFEIKPALVFAVLFVMLSVVTVFVLRLYGDTGLIVLAAITGVTDIDPFILSLVNQTPEFHNMILAAVLVSMMGNTVMKGLYFGFLAKAARGQSLIRYGIWALLHVPFILLSR
ncbi:MAG: MgtC/SapB family protein [candidate division Zixibacteria bacterium]|nr:MgtC/SapB family protein [candidate division Zixibacteria bacterium]